ncbi:hypothetical protein BDN70DRAFT_901290 [Pholiota conissans]|uniref:Uncharacterized protein n=1 Tax=Pholiota conissans TaxID=109636 RepID=A0A9P5YLU0_9AGAR|nr:hypothetical protein BDN70DRAFT_901290 [Pholiota conissans]
MDIGGDREGDDNVLHSRWWEAWQEPRASITPELQDRLKAYAVGQAADQRALSIAFQKIWKTLLTLIDKVDSAVRISEGVDGDSNGEEELGYGNGGIEDKGDGQGDIEGGTRYVGSEGSRNGGNID